MTLQSFSETWCIGIVYFHDYREIRRLCSRVNFLTNSAWANFFFSHVRCKYSAFLSGCRLGVLWRMRRKGSWEQLPYLNFGLLEIYRFCGKSFLSKSTKFKLKIKIWSTHNVLCRKLAAIGICCNSDENLRCLSENSCDSYFFDVRRRWIRVKLIAACGSNIISSKHTCVPLLQTTCHARLTF